VADVADVLGLPAQLLQVLLESVDQLRVHRHLHLGLATCLPHLQVDDRISKKEGQLSLGISHRADVKPKAVPLPVVAPVEPEDRSTITAQVRSTSLPLAVPPGHQLCPIEGPSEVVGAHDFSGVGIPMAMHPECSDDLWLPGFVSVMPALHLGRWAQNQADWVPAVYRAR
jgi:hypothetical protein